MCSGSTHSQNSFLLNDQCSSKKRLRLYYGYLFRIGVERVNVQFRFACLKIYIAERLKPADRLIRKSHKDAPIAGKFLKIDVALPIKIRAHFFDLKICHVAKILAQRAFVAALTAELESFKKASLRQHLVGRIYQFRQAQILCEYA